MTEPLRELLPDQQSIARLRVCKREATQALLGDTIRLGDDQWQEPSLLPGWTRAHVATHVARNAEAFTDAIEALLAGRPRPLYRSRVRADEEIEVGSRRTGLDLQIDLDTTAGRLNAAFDALDASGISMPVGLTERLRVPAGWWVAARLSEVVLHHVDLHCGLSIEAIDADVAAWLLGWELFRGSGDAAIPPVEVASDSGVHGRVGPLDRRSIGTVSGGDALLVGWLSGRSEATGLAGDAAQFVPAWLDAH